MPKNTPTFVNPTLLGQHLCNDDDDDNVNFWTVFAAPYPSATSWLETSHTLLDTNSIREDCDEDFDQDLEEDLNQNFINHSYHNPMKSVCPILQQQQKHI